MSFGLNIDISDLINKITITNLKLVISGVVLFFLGLFFIWSGVKFENFKPNSSPIEVGGKGGSAPGAGGGGGGFLEVPIQKVGMEVKAEIRSF